MASIALANVTLAGASALTAGQVAFATATLSAVGAFIDNAFLMPALFPPDPVEGQKIGEIGIMGADKGSPTSMVYGSYAKVAGQLLWATELIETSTTREYGKGSKKITYEYFVNVAVGICRTGATALSSIDAVLADEQVIYTSADRQVIDEFVGNGVFWYYEVTEWSNGVPTEWDAWIIFDPFINPSIVADMWSNINVDDIINVTGGEVGNNDSSDKVLRKGGKNITFSVTDPYGTGSNYDSSYDKFYITVYYPYTLKVQKEKVTSTSTRVINQVPDYCSGFNCNWGSQPPTDFTILAGNAYISTISIVGQIGWSDGVQKTGSPTIYLGNNSSPNSLISAQEGAVDTPAFRDMAYIVFHQLNLENYGIRIPNFEFICSNSVKADARACILDILQDSELLPAEYNVSSVSASEIVGYSVVGITETIKKIQPIALAYGILLQERGGVLHFLTHSPLRSVIELEMDYVGAYADNKPTGGVRVTQTPVSSKHGEVSLTYVDSADDNKFTQGLERATAFSQSNVEARETQSRWSKMSVNLPISMTPDDAREIAHRILWTQWADDLTFSMTLPARYIALQENDRISVPVGDNVYTALIMKVDMGANFMMEIDAKLDTAIEQDFSGWKK